MSSFRVFKDISQVGMAQTGILFLANGSVVMFPGLRFRLGGVGFLCVYFLALSTVFVPAGSAILILCIF